MYLCNNELNQMLFSSMHKSFFLLSLACLVIVSCNGFGAAQRDAALRSLLPGECLEGTELQARPVKYRQMEKDLLFSFGLLLGHHELVRRSSHPLSSDHDDLPTEELFDQFGVNKSKVLDAYHVAFDSFFSSSHDSYFGRTPYTTILYTGGLSLVADKDFAGKPAGEDLSSLVHSFYGESSPVLSSYYSSKEEAGSILSFPYDYVCLLETGVLFVIPVGSHAVTSENVTFHLEIPVRVILFLQWLNEQTDNPDVAPPYYDAILHATFTSSVGLK